jgi:benzoyl-CoA reductase/2-hydroxyglutaryl-CoA dehydratase subunit BcrC/BadD/HgdB
VANAGTFRTAIKAVEKNSKNMSSEYIISQLCGKIRMQYDLYDGLCESIKEQRQIHHETTCQKDTKEGDKEI